MCVCSLCVCVCETSTLIGRPDTSCISCLSVKTNKISVKKITLKRSRDLVVLLRYRIMLDGSTLSI